MKGVRYIVLVLLLLSSAMGFADGIFSSTYGEKWVTITAKTNCAYFVSYASYSGTDQLCYIQGDANALSDNEKWCLVGSADNFLLYNKAKGEKYVVDAPSSAADNGYIGFVTSGTGHLELVSSGGSYSIHPGGTSEYWNLLGSGSGWEYHIGYWSNAEEDNALWNIAEYSDAPVCYSDGGSSISKHGYSLVFSSETEETAAQFLRLSETERSNCKGSFTDQASLENTWGYCPLSTATWNKRMGSTLAEKRQNISYSNGVLKLYAKTVKSASDGTQKFLTSGVQSVGSYQYGIIEIKAKTNAYTGNFPALWFMPDASRKGTDRGWPYCGEIDLMEMVNNSYTAHGTVHNANCSCVGGASFTASHAADGNYHIYTLMWNADSLAWYIDGEQFYTYIKDKSLSGEDLLNQYPYDKPYYIILNQSVGAGGWAANPDESHTYEMDVAYVRVYQQGGDDMTLELTDDNPGLVVGTCRKGNISYTRSVNNYYSGFCVPFDVDLSTMKDNFKEVYLPADSAVYDVPSNVLTTYYYRHDMDRILPANTPFLAVMATDADGGKISQEICFTSCTDTHIASTDDPAPSQMNVYDMDANGNLTVSASYSIRSGGSLKKSVHGQTEGYYIPYGTKRSWGLTSSLNPFRHYIKVTKLSSSAMTPTFAIGLMEAPAAIGDVTQVRADGPIFDITGRKAGNGSLRLLPKGIYIMNNRKFFVK